VVQQIAQPRTTILDLYGVDVIDVGRAFDTGDEDWYDITLPQGIRVQFPCWFRPIPQAGGRWDAYTHDGTYVATMPVGATFFDQTVFPYLDGYPGSYADLPAAMGKVHWSALAHSPWDHAGEADFWQQLREKALALRARSDRAIMIVCGCNLFEWGTFLRRMDNFLADLAQDQAGAERLLDALLEQHLATREGLRSCRRRADILRFAMAGTDRTFMSPQLIASSSSRFTILCDYVHQHSSMHTFLHSSARSTNCSPT
jgi:uroporphyrinogen decarboxylase